MNVTQAILKTLSPNDLGETGAHQAGILIPKRPAILSYFPSLDHVVKNPRQSLSFYEDDGVTKWNFEFIYYNNKLFGGTRNEFRLTWMTKYLRAKNAKVGDQIELSVDANGRRYVKLIRKGDRDLESDVIKLSGTWKIISFKK